MSARTVFTCDACGVTGDGVVGDYAHPDPPVGWVWFWGSALRMTGPHACSEKCWREVQTSPDGRLYLPDSHERRAETPARRATDAELAPTTPPAPRGPQAVVYFIQRGDDGPVKIGYSRNPKGRLVSLQTSIPERLCILGIVDGGKTEEMRLHRHFSAHCIHGEWFHPAPELLAYIREHGRQP